jgi:hypothetical protein
MDAESPRSTRRREVTTAAFIVFALTGAGLAWSDSPAASQPRAPAEAERRAVAYLAREVPRWSRENRCFSCHNNGDGARALFAAKAGFRVAPESLSDTIAWLSRPGSWETNRGDPAFSDKRLARLQFTLALAAAIDAKAIADRTAIVIAARLVAKDQAADGSWPIDEAALVGSPATYGRPLATALARRALASADASQFAAAIAKANRWLRAQPVRNVAEASAVLIGMDPEDPGDDALRARCHDLLRRAQSENGGWGPFVNAPSEPFDTALAMIALDRGPNRAEAAPMLARGRAYLIAAQSDDGSWPETTRPSGGESYAQRISTTGWVAMALLALE